MKFVGRKFEGEEIRRGMIKEMTHTPGIKFLDEVIRGIIVFVVLRGHCG